MISSKEIKAIMRKRFPLVDWYVSRLRTTDYDAFQIRYHCGTEEFYSEVKQAIVELFEVKPDEFSSEHFCKPGLLLELYWIKRPHYKQVRRKAVRWYPVPYNDIFEEMHLQLECGHLTDYYYNHYFNSTWENQLPTGRLRCPHCMEEQRAIDQQEHQKVLDILSQPIKEN